MKSFNSVAQGVFAKIGLEVHVTLSSVRKIFNFNDNLPTSGRPTNSVESWELGYLGILPVLNSEAIKLALKTCLLLNAKINRQVTFNRKVYNYFDLSKGFQITQQDNPIGENGCFTFIFNEEAVTVPISRIQLEEDTAKASYQKAEIMLDFSRSGSPLLEIVTEPVFTNVDSVMSFVKQLQSALNYTGVSGAKMEQGELRIDLNFSFEFDSDYKTPRYEVKNLNSIRNLKASFEQELEKHVLIYKNRSRKNCFFKSQTLGFNQSLNRTFVQRKKTNYFYLPESNIPIILVDDSEIASLKEEMPTNLLPIWYKLNEKDNSRYSIMLFEKPLLARAVNSLEKEGIDYFSNFVPFTSFFFNYILVNVQSYNNDEVVAQFLGKKMKYLWDLFIFFEKRLVAKERISGLITMLYTEHKSYSAFQWKELLKKGEDNEQGFTLDIEKEVATIFSEKKVNRKLMSQPSRIANFLLGALKDKFPSSEFDYQKIFEIASSSAIEPTD